MAIYDQKLYHFIICKKIYEVCMFVLNSPDNRLVSSALECLQVLFKALPFRFNIFLSSPGAMSASFLSRRQQPIQQPLEPTTPDSQRETTENTTAQNLESLTATEPVTTPAHLQGQFYSKLNAPIEYFVRYLAFKFLLGTKEDLATCGHDTDSTEYRLGKLKPDSQVRVLIKTIAFDCCTSAIQLKPTLVFYSVYDSWICQPSKNVETDEFLNDSETEANEPLTSPEATDFRSNLFLYDLINYIHHPDDKMRQDACLLIGSLIQTVLIESNGNYEVWLARMTNYYFANNYKQYACSKVYESLQLEVLVDYLVKLVKVDDQKISNNMCKKAAVR